MIISEDKVKALPNFIKLSKYKYVFLDILDEFNKKEIEEFTYVSDKQY